MKQLNKFQLAVLEKAAGADERIAALLHKYNKPMPQFDKEIVNLSLLEAYDYWACYFACGQEKADQLKEEKRLNEQLESMQLILKARKYQ